jgi:hypothetical protein
MRPAISMECGSLLVSVVVLVGLSSRASAAVLFAHPDSPGELNGEQVRAQLEAINSSQHEATVGQAVVNIIYRAGGSTEVFEDLTVSELIEFNEVSLASCTGEELGKRAHIFVMLKPNENDKDQVAYYALQKVIGVYLTACLRRTVNYCLEHTLGDSAQLRDRVEEMISDWQNYHRSS